MKNIEKALTIAGSDSGGGAGIQADLKTFSALSVYGMSAITSVTSQNTLGVRSSFDLPPEEVAGQIDAVLEDMGAEAVKTGMLGNEAIVDVVCQRLKKHKVGNIVVDPVMIAKGGASLINKKGVERVFQKLLPLATVVTPNIPEAEILAGIKIRDEEGMRKAAELLGSGKRAVLIKGGHLKKDKKCSTDLLFFKGGFFSYESPRLKKEHTHGTGCTLSAAITAGLAQGKPVPEAVERAKALVTRGIARGLDIGGGIGPVHHLEGLWQDAERYHLVEDMERILSALGEASIGCLVPEIQSNIALAPRFAETEEEVLGIPGRLIAVGEGITTVASPAFGGSRHVARIVLTAKRADPSIRVAMALRFSREILDSCKRAGFTMGSFSRAKEPKNVRVREGSSLEWGTAEAIRKFKGVPTIIYDLGGMGKEPVVRLLATSADDLIEKVLVIKRGLE